MIKPIVLMGIATILQALHINSGGLMVVGGLLLITAGIIRIVRADSLDKYYLDYGVKK
jgi:small neutral amino acid transporter SnatA (MarC family)